MIYGLARILLTNLQASWESVNLYASEIAAVKDTNLSGMSSLTRNVSKEMIDYWNKMFADAPEVGAAGLRTALSKFDLARDGVLQRIKAPTMIITADRSALQSVEKVRAYQLAIPHSRLVP